MKCPVCITAELKMTDRQGVEIDYCPDCRGIWLDRGELDKIIERSYSQSPQTQQAVPQQTTPQPQYQHGGESALATMLVLRLRSCLLWNCLLGLWGLRIGSFDDLIEFTTVEPYSTTIRAVINLHSLAICHLKFSSNTYRAFHTHVLL